jgi:hypothetical protein
MQNWSRFVHSRRNEALEKRSHFCGTRLFAVVVPDQPHGTTQEIRGLGAVERPWSGRAVQMVDTTGAAVVAVDFAAA